MGCGPQLEFLYKVALLMEKLLSSEEKLCLLSRGLLLASGSHHSATKRNPYKREEKKKTRKNLFVQECSAVVVCLMITATNCLSYPQFDFAALTIYYFFILLFFLFFGLFRHEQKRN